MASQGLIFVRVDFRKSVAEYLFLLQFFAFTSSYGSKFKFVLDSTPFSLSESLLYFMPLKHEFLELGYTLLICSEL
jgi:hypothetical protein